MKHKIALSLLLFGICLAQSACNNFKFKADSQRETICKELNSRMTFGGNTSNNRQSEIATVEDVSLQQQYDKYHCADF